MTDHTERSDEQILADLDAIAVGVGVRAKLAVAEAAHRVLGAAPGLLARAVRAEQECDELRRIVDDLSVVARKPMEQRWSERIEQVAQDCETACSERDEARRERDEQRAFIQRLADRGLSCDLNPTMLFGRDETAMYEAWRKYLSRVDTTIRAEAAAALAGPHDTKEN